MYNHGKYSFEENNTKIKVTTSTGQDSVLFEDIASIGWTRMQFITNPNAKTGVIIIIASILLGPIIGINISISAGLLVFGVGMIIGGLLLIKTKTNYFDRISVETKGGKIISFDVPDGSASNEVEKIENTKRQITGIK